MLSNFPSSLVLVLAAEGGFVDHPSDPGGMTNLGVTQKAWRDWVKRGVDEAEMRSLTPEQVAPMYKSKYWDACKCDDLPRGVDYAVFDAAVNMGPGRAAKLLQAALGVTADGRIGRATLAAAIAADPSDLIEIFSYEKEAFYQSLPTFEIFGRGWFNRVARVQTDAGKMMA